MTFSSMWPLIFVVAVPLIIILYFLKPRGKDQKVSSNILWERLFKNVQSKTFFEKFMHNILMYLQILITLFLIFSLMSPYISTKGFREGRVILLIDTSASMQHAADSGKTRFEETIETACKLVDNTDNAEFTVVSCSNQASLVISSTEDKSAVKKALKDMQCTDIAGDLREAENFVESLIETSEDGVGKVVVFTDGQGAGAVSFYAEELGAEISVINDAKSNVSIDYVTSAKNDDGTYDIILKLSNYSDNNVAMDITLYESDDTIIKVLQAQMNANDSSIKLCQGITWNSDYIKAEISGMDFAGDSKIKDSLKEDNVSYAIKDAVGEAKGVLISPGNSFVERAFKAVTGNDITRADNDSVIGTADYNVAIYDAGINVSLDENKQINRLVFAGKENAIGDYEGVYVTVKNSKLTQGLNDFNIGVNKVTYYTLPSWGSSFMECDGKCVGYYGEHDGIKEIVIGFDIRESDFALLAEYPIFMANSLTYLADTSALSSNVFYPGDKVGINPSSDVDVNTISAPTNKAGIYTVTVGDKTEYYVVRFSRTTSNSEFGAESDARVSHEASSGETELKEIKVRKSLRNILLILSIILLVIEWFIYLRQTAYKGKFYYIVRVACTLMIILALIGLSIPRNAKKTTTIFLVDVSDSNLSNKAEISTYISEQIKDMPSKNEYGIIAFGKDTQVEQFITENKMFAGIMTTPDKNATNFEEAIGSAISMIPPDSAGRVVLLTDGKETKGNIYDTASSVVRANIEVDAVIFESASGEDAYVAGVDMPSYLHEGDQFNMKVTVASNYETDATITVMSGSKIVHEENVHLNRGNNQFVFPQEVTGDTVENYDVKVQAIGDTQEENDMYSAYSLVEAPPRVLLVSGTGEDSENFKALLNATGINYDVVSPKNVPTTIDGLLEYKCVILENVYIDDLKKGFTDNIETFVKDYGCGLITTGGERSYALGGYRGTVLEEILPVTMDLTGVNEIPSMAMVMVIDHSGSMYDFVDDTYTATNLTLAIQAACEAVKNLRDTDYVGVVTFDDEYTWQVPVQLANNKESIIAEIEEIDYGGGTTIKPALKQAYEEINKTDATIKHIILLTDGMGETTNFSDVVTNMNSAGITLSTVAVGEYSDTELLEKLAEDCGGRYYYSDISTDIPRIFAQEVFLGGDAFIQNGTFGIDALSSHQLVEGLFPESWPVIYGYIATTKKPTATGVIQTAAGDPVLTTWQYGLGKTTAWSTDVTNEWTSEYADKDEYAQMWKRIIEYTAGNSSLGDDDLSVVNEKGMTTVKYVANGYTEETNIVANYTGPDGQTGEMQLICTAPGVFEGQIDADTPGLYNFSVNRKEGAEVVNSVVTASAVQFSDEYKFDIGNESFKSFVNQYGLLLEKTDTVWHKLKNIAIERYSLTNLFILLSILLFVIDVAIRRFNVIIKKREKKEKYMKVKLANGGEAMIPVNPQDAMPYDEDTAGGTTKLKGKAAPAMGQAKGERAAERARLKAEKAANKKNGGNNSGSNGPSASVGSGGALDTSALLNKKNNRNM